MQQPTYAMNASDSDHCGVCDDTGLVALKGTVKQHGVEYSRGVTACLWCEHGRNKFTRLSATGNKPDMDYRLEDVAGYGDDHRPATPNEVKAALRLMRGNVAKPLPPVHESNATIEARKTAAAQAAREAERPADDEAGTPPPHTAPVREPKPAAPPEPYNPDEIPF